MVSDICGCGRESSSHPPRKPMLLLLTITRYAASHFSCKRVHFDLILKVSACDQLTNHKVWSCYEGAYHGGSVGEEKSLPHHYVGHSNTIESSPPTL